MDLFWIKTDSDGRFSLHAVCPPGPLRIWVGQKGYCAEMARPVRRGARDERFVLKKAARLTGSIRVGTVLPKWSIWVRVVGIAAAVDDFANPVSWKTSEPPDPRTATLNGEIDWDSIAAVGALREIPFHVEGLRPGPGRVEIRLRDQPEPLHVVQGLPVRRGETRPPRLQGINLAWRIRTVGITVENGHGRLPEDAELRIFRGVERRHADSTNVKRRLTWKRGREPVRPEPIQLGVDCESRLDVEVFAPGYRSVRLDRVRQDHRVVLRPGIPVRIDLPRRVPDDHHFHASLERVRVDGIPRFLFPSDHRRFHFGKEVPVSLSQRVPAPGRYRASVYPSIGHEWARVEFDVKDTTALQVFTARVDSPRGAER